MKQFGPGGSLFINDLTNTFNLTHCAFSWNKAGMGGAVYIGYVGHPFIEGYGFSEQNS